VRLAGFEGVSWTAHTVVFVVRKTIEQILNLTRMAQ
jgi:hypothetical protein